MTTRLHILRVIEQLEKTHGIPKSPRFADPLEIILWENVVYLAETGNGG